MIGTLFLGSFLIAFAVAWSLFRWYPAWARHRLLTKRWLCYGCGRRFRGRAMVTGLRRHTLHAGSGGFELYGYQLCIGCAAEREW